ncbi:CASP-like protein 2B1 [Hirschfeldia incana]|nr:CASP-like protein 2B1 [Hirschfeldia incana]
MSYSGVGNSPGHVAVFHGGKMKLIDRRLKLTELFLRCSATVLALLALILIVTDTQVKRIFTIEKKAKYTDMKSLVFLVVANGIVAAYSLLQSVRCVVGSVKGSVLLNKSLAWAIFLGDQAMAYMSVAAIAASAESGLIGIRGEEKLQWMKLCNMFGKFCNRAAGGTATALLASVAMVFVSSISAFSLFRLYGGATTQRQPNLAVTK